MELLTWLNAIPGNLIALGALALALWRYLDRKFERIDSQLITLNREIGKIEGRLDAVQAQINTTS